jgi:hypothetical protein
MYIHIVGHVLLDDGRYHRTIWEPSRRERAELMRRHDSDARLHKHADLLTEAILWGKSLSEWDSAWRKATAQDEGHEQRERRCG